MLGVGKLTAIYATDKLNYKLGLMESELGNFGEGRFAWRLEEGELYQPLIWCAGQKNLWQWNGRGAGEASYGKV